MENSPKNYASLSEIHAAIEEILTAENMTMFHKYGIARIHYKFNLKYDLEKGIYGITIEDMVLEVFESFAKEGGRNWNKTDFPKFIKQFFSALDSHISNTISKVFQKHINTDHIEDSTSEILDNNDVNYDHLLEESLKILEDLGADSDELILFEPYYVYKMKRADIAKQYGVSESELTNIKKRIDNKLPRLRMELNKVIYG